MSGGYPYLQIAAVPDCTPSVGTDRHVWADIVEIMSSVVSHQKVCFWTTRISSAFRIPWCVMGDPAVCSATHVA